MQILNLLRRLAGLLTWIYVGMVCAADGAAVTPEAKVALVIGNERYPSIAASLKNPVNDARLMAQTLRKLGFAVQQYDNLDRGAMLKAVRDFSAGIPAGATSFVYYAGHGMQVSGSSYLVPTDMEVTSEQKVPFRALALNSVLESVSQSRAAINIIVLDACRNNPFQPPSPVKYRSLGNMGLAAIHPPRGTLLAYSTAPNQKAPDGLAEHSVYTAALAAALLEPGYSLLDTFLLVGERVRRQSRDDQIPWFESSLAGDYFLLSPGPGTVLSRNGAATVPDKRGQPGRSRELVAALQPWYRNLDEREWSQLDFDIRQRVAALTPDELPLLEHQAQGGNVMAQTTLGVVWREGVERAAAAGQTPTRFRANNTKSIQWLRMAAQAGFPIAQIELAEMLYRGRGSARDIVQARSLATSAAQANYPRAKLDLLQMDTEEGVLDMGAAAAAFESATKAYRPPGPAGSGAKAPR